MQKFIYFLNINATYFLRQRRYCLIVSFLVWIEILDKNKHELKFYWKNIRFFKFTNKSRIVQLHFRDKYFSSTLKSKLVFEKSGLAESDIN